MMWESISTSGQVTPARKTARRRGESSRRPGIRQWMTFCLPPRRQERHRMERVREMQGAREESHSSSTLRRRETFSSSPPPLRVVSLGRRVRSGEVRRSGGHSTLSGCWRSRMNGLRGRSAQNCKRSASQGSASVSGGRERDRHGLRAVSSVQWPARANLGTTIQRKKREKEEESAAVVVGRLGEVALALPATAALPDCLP